MKATAALARMRKGDRLTTAQLRRALDDLEKLWRGLVHGETLLAQASGAARAHSLRAYDASISLAPLPSPLAKSSTLHAGTRSCARPRAQARLRADPAAALIVSSRPFLRRRCDTVQSARKSRGHRAASPLMSTPNPKTLGFGYQYIFIEVLYSAPPATVPLEQSLRLLHLMTQFRRDLNQLTSMRSQSFSNSSVPETVRGSKIDGLRAAEIS